MPKFEACSYMYSHIWKRLVTISLRSKSFCGFSEQRKTEEQDFDNFARQEMGMSEKIERGGRGEGIMEQKME